MVLTGLFLLCLLWGVWGLMDSGKRFLDACYLSLQLLTLNAGLEDGPKNWKLEIARFALPGILAYTVLLGMFLFAKRDLSFLKLMFFKEKHYVICGLGGRGMALARDLIKNGKIVAAIEKDPNNSHIPKFMAMGGILIEGDARESDQLERASLRKAAHLILLTDTDVSNLKIIHAALSVIGKETSKLKCYVHIANRENRALFEEGGVFFPPIRPNGLELSLFNVYENAAIELFQAHTLGTNADTLSEDATPVRLLIAGFGRMAEAVLLEAMQLGHFCNQVPVEITVLDEDAKAAEQRFFQRYREIPNHLGEKGLRLWSLIFVDTIEAAGALGRYTDILACHDDEDRALLSINNLWECWQCEENQRKTHFFLYSLSGRVISNEEVAPFGNFDQACSKKTVIVGELEKMAAKSHEVYKRPKLKDRNSDLDSKVENGLALEEALIEHDRTAEQAQKLAWKSLSLLKRASNFSEKRHYGVKLMALGLQKVEGEMAVSDTSSLQAADFPFLDDANLMCALSLLASATTAAGLDKEALLERIHNLAKAEHNRWNAFHVLNNFRYGQKDERKRTHDCLLSWDDLEKKKHDTVKYDYQNIYQMLDILQSIKSGVMAIR